MKEICKKLYRLTILFFQTVVSFISVFLFSSLNTAIGMKKREKRMPSKDCLILGNGPSLANSLKSVLEKIKDYDVVAVNHFCENKEFHEVKPKYYVLADPAFFDPNPKEERIAKEQECLKKGFDKVNWDMILFLPSINRESFLVKEINNRNIEICFYNLTPVNGIKSIRHWLYKNDLGMPQAMNVLCASIFLMTNLKYKNIYLLGADHSWLDSFFVNENNELILSDRHFYGTDQIKRNTSISVWLNKISVCFLIHEFLSEYAQYRGVNVWNATKHSYIDAYVRKELN